MGIISPNMGLTISTIGTDIGLQWEQNLNASEYIIDGHNHSPGSGVQISPLGLDISSNLSFQNNSATNIYGLFFGASSSNVSTGLLYTAPSSGGGINDLFYNDFAGNVIQLTKAGATNAPAASIPGESYAGGTFTWVQGAASITPANFDIGSVTLRPNTPGTTNGITVSPPSAISSAYSIILPALPVSQSFMTIDQSGNVLAPVVYPLVNAGIANATITGAKLVNNTITATQIANATITTTQISATAGIIPGQLATVSVGTDLSIGTYSNTTTTFVTVGSFNTAATPATGRPVLIRATPNGYTFTVTAANATAAAVYSNNGFQFVVNTTISGGTSLNMTGTGAPSASGTLTKVSGTGDATITFSAFTTGIVLNSFLQYSTNGSVNSHAAILQIVRTSDSKVINSVEFGGLGTGTATNYISPISSLNCIDISDGTATYFLRLRNVITSADTVSINQLLLSAVAI